MRRITEDVYKRQGFISGGFSAEICFIIFTFITLAIIYAGVRSGIERVSKFMMPILVVLSLIIMIYSITRPGAMAGVKYFLVPNVKNFSWMTVVAAMGQMFYSLSIAMGILITFGSYMKKDLSIESSTKNVEIFDTAIAIMAGLMIIPAVFAFSGGDPDALKAGPSLMFITIPKMFESMGLSTVVGILFFTLVLFAALTSSIALTESAVSTFEDEFGWGRKKSTIIPVSYTHLVFLFPHQWQSLLLLLVLLTSQNTLPALYKVEILLTPRDFLHFYKSQPYMDSWQISHLTCSAQCFLHNHLQTQPS